MEEKQRIELLESHKILLREKDQGIADANQTLQSRIKEFQDAIVIITKALGIPKEDIGKWKLSGDGEAIEKIKENKKE